MENITERSNMLFDYSLDIKRCLRVNLVYLLGSRYQLKVFIVRKAKIRIKITFKIYVFHNTSDKNRDEHLTALQY